MDIPGIILYMQLHPWTVKLGARKTAKLTHSNLADVLEARKTIQLSRGIQVRPLRLNSFKKSYLAPKATRIPRILIFDIETAPMKAYVWRRWKENISLDLTISEWFMLAWSAKWLYSNTIYHSVLSPEEVHNEDDSRLCKGLWELMSQADVAVAHNGNHFDIPKTKSRFIVNGLPPLKPFFSVDTCLIAKRQFGFSSNKLDALAEYFGFEHKLDTDFSLWKRCMEGDSEALEYMDKYNQKDVELLEEVYIRLLPWIKNHPNVGNLISSKVPVCSNCGSSHLNMMEDEYYYTSVGKYHLFRCKCGCVSRGRVNLNKELNKITSVLK